MRYRVTVARDHHPGHERANQMAQPAPMLDLPFEDPARCSELSPWLSTLAKLDQNSGDLELRRLQT
jgi:hypothetical protein